MARKRDRVQVTCYCKAYSFPHRIGGGLCNGSQWAEDYMTWVREECELCNCLRSDSVCDVVTGVEDFKHCEGFQDHLRRQPDQRLPVVDVDKFIGVYEEE